MKIVSSVIGFFKNIWFVNYEKQDAIDEMLFLPTKRDPILDIYSDTGAFVSKWAIEELAKVREMNDQVSRGVEETAALRGRIKVLKEILVLGSQNKKIKKQIEVDEDFAGY